LASYPVFSVSLENMSSSYTNGFTLILIKAKLGEKWMRPLQAQSLKGG
jgi:hypothetical protein